MHIGLPGTITTSALHALFRSVETAFEPSMEQLSLKTTKLSQLDTMGLLQEMIAPAEQQVSALVLWTPTRATRKEITIFAGPHTRSPTHYYVLRGMICVAQLYTSRANPAQGVAS